MKRRGFLAVPWSLSAILSCWTAPTAAQTRPPPAPAQLDLNSASRDELMSLDGIGEVRAEAIVRARPFRAKTELVERRLIPEALYERIADKVTVRAPPPPPRPPPAQPRRG
jgi:competence protein ComEA